MILSLLPVHSMTQKPSTLTDTYIAPPEVLVGFGILGPVNHTHSLVAIIGHIQIVQALARLLLEDRSVHNGTESIRVF